VAIHRAVVEVFAALATSRPLKKLPYPQPGALLDETKDVQVIPTADGLGATLQFLNSETQRVVLQSAMSKSAASTMEIPQLSDAEGLEAVAQEESIVSTEHTTVPQTYTTESLRQTIKTWGRGWLHVKLLHPVIKFAVSQQTMAPLSRLEIYLNTC